MRLGTDTGSLMNHVMSNAQTPAPKVGDGATVLHWTDRVAGTIIEVADDGNSFVVQDDKVTRTDTNGLSEAQSYDYAPDPDGGKTTFRRVKRGKAAGQFRENGKNSGYGVLIGHRNHYHDFSF